MPLFYIIFYSSLFKQHLSLVTHFLCLLQGIRKSLKDLAFILGVDESERGEGGVSVSWASKSPSQIESFSSTLRKLVCQPSSKCRHSHSHSWRRRRRRGRNRRRSRGPRRSRIQSQNQRRRQSRALMPFSPRAKFRSPVDSKVD